MKIYFLEILVFSKINPDPKKAFTGQQFTSMHTSSEKFLKKSIVGKNFSVVVELGVLGKKLKKVSCVFLLSTPFAKNINFYHLEM